VLGRLGLWPLGSPDDWYDRIKTGIKPHQGELQAFAVPIRGRYQKRLRAHILRALSLDVPRARLGAARVVFDNVDDVGAGAAWEVIPTWLGSVGVLHTVFTRVVVGFDRAPVGVFEWFTRYPLPSPAGFRASLRLEAPDPGTIAECL
jgi:hypothetical protein